MAIPVILKGETARPIPLTMAEGHDYGGCELLVDLCGVRRTFGGLAAGGTVELRLSAEETAAMPLGTSKLLLSLRNPAGEVRHLPWAKVRVTDCPADAHGAGVAVDPATLEVEDLAPSDSLGVVKARLNAVLAFLRGASAAALVLLAPGAWAAAVPLFTTPNDIPGDAPVMTNVAEYVDSATNAVRAYEDMAVGVASATAFQTMEHATNALWAAKADYSALDGYATAADVASVGASVSAVWEQVYGENVWIAVTNYLRTTSAKPSMGLWERRDGATNLVWSSDEEITAKVDALRVETTNLVSSAQSAAESARAWGKFQGADGSAAPEGFTMVTTPYVMLTGGGKWEQRTVESGGSYWLFCGSGSVGGASDGGLKMTDSNGETVFEVSQSSVREVPAIPSSFSVERVDNDWGNTVDRVSFAVRATSAPKLYYAEDLAGPWTEFYYQGWSPSGEGEYATLFDMIPPLPRAFFKAVYETGAESVVDFRKILKVSRVQVSNAVYRASVGTTSDGTKFLKLEDE